MIASHRRLPARVASLNDSYVKRLEDPIDDLSQVEKGDDAIRRVDDFAECLIRTKEVVGHVTSATFTAAMESKDVIT
jgi:hypothetical protein